MPESSDREFRPYGEHHVIVPVGSLLLGVYKHATLGPLLLENDKHSLDACLHPDHTENAYVLPRYIVEPIAAYLQRIGVNGKKRAAEKKKASEKKRAAVISPPPLLPPPALPSSDVAAAAATPLPPLDVLTEMTDEMLAHIFSYVDLKSWAALSRMNARLRAFAMDPSIFAKVLSNIAIQRVMVLAKTLITRQTTVVPPNSDLMQLMEGFARRFINVEGARHYLIHLCSFAARKYQYAFVNVLLARTAARRDAVVDLRDEGYIVGLVPFLTVNVTNTAYQHIAAQIVASLVAWKPTMDAEITSPIFDSMTFNMMVGRVHGYDFIAQRDLVEVIRRLDRVEYWIYVLVGSEYPGIVEKTVEILPALLSLYTQRGGDVNRLLTRLALSGYHWTIEAIKQLAAWRGPAGEYVDLAECFERPLELDLQRSAVFYSVNAIDVIDLFLAWRSPSPTARFVDLREPRVLSTLLSFVEGDLGKLAQQFLIRTFLRWRDPIASRNLPLALFADCCPKHLFKQSIIYMAQQWFGLPLVGEEPVVRSPEVVSESDMRLILTRHDAVLLSFLLQEKENLLAFSKLYTVVVPSTPLVTNLSCASWLFADGGAELYNVSGRKALDLDKLIAITEVAGKRYDALAYLALLFSAPVPAFISVVPGRDDAKNIQGQHVRLLMQQFALSDADMPASVSVTQRFEGYVLTLTQRLLLADALMAKSNRLRAAAGLSPNVINEVLEYD